MTRYLTADLHFGHARMIDDGLRPFADVGEMNRVMIGNWNAVVSDRDIVDIVGDFAFSMTKEEVLDLFHSLKGRKRLILGNHDVDHSGEVKRVLANLPWDRPPVHRAEIKHQGQRIVLDHFAGLSWNAAHYGAYLAFGHSHGALPGLPGSVDVGVDCQNFRPISVEEFVRQADDTIRNHARTLDAAVDAIRARSGLYGRLALELDGKRPAK